MKSILSKSSIKSIDIRGVLWKPGINGLGVRGCSRLLPYRHRFNAAACEHDANYDEKGKAKDRRIYDIHFLRCMTKACQTDLQVFFAIVYYVIVRLFGWLFYRYNRDNSQYLTPQS